MLSFLDIFGAKKAPPQLTFGMPIDLSADVPIFPPFALMLTMMTARLMWKLSGKRLSYVPAPLSALPVRIAILAIGLACTKFLVLDKAGGELKAAGSGTLFTPVGGLAVDGIYQMTRNVSGRPRAARKCCSGLRAFQRRLCALQRERRAFQRRALQRALCAARRGRRRATRAGDRHRAEERVGETHTYRVSSRQGGSLN